MEQLINDIYEIVKDYRADEGKPRVQMTTDRIKRWVDQFDEQDRQFILTELKDILKKRYCSKAKVLNFLKQVIDKLTEDFKYSSPQAFLQETIFLDLQPARKSQKKMLELMKELLTDKYDFDFNECGSTRKKNFIYLDDVLCTGNTLFRDIEEWAKVEYTTGTTNQKAIEDGTAKLIFAFIVLHEKNHYKKQAQMRHKISQSFANNITTYRLIKVQNGSGNTSTMDFLYPLEADQSQTVLDYQTSITEQVDEYTQKYDRTSPEEYYRASNLPQEEKFFSSKENRQRFENILLNKGITILDNASTNIKNMRALGYSLPSFKDFGFGTLCFTWRNVPNNTPLVFWYSGGGFFPLFEKKSGNDILDFFAIPKRNKPSDPADDLPF